MIFVSAQNVRCIARSVDLQRFHQQQENPSGLSVMLLSVG
jgi:hypothetical protein